MLLPSKVNLLINPTHHLHGGTMNNKSSSKLIALCLTLASLVLIVTGYELRELSKLIAELRQEVSVEAASESLKLPERVSYPHTLVPGTAICFKPDYTNNTSFTVINDVYEMPRGEDKGGIMPVVELESLDGHRTIITLAELGILPYPGGNWGQGRTFFGLCSKGA